MKNWFKKHPKIYAIRYAILICLIVFLSVIIDLVTKIVTDGKHFQILGEFFMFTSVHNDGAAYGIFGGETIWLIIVTSIILAIILIYNYFKKDKTILYSISIGLIIGGAIGNLIDRIFLGYVRDFIRFGFFSFTFNFADACLTVGVIIFAIYLIFFDKTFKFKKDKKSGENNDA